MKAWRLVSVLAYCIVLTQQQADGQFAVHGDQGVLEIRDADRTVATYAYRDAQVRRPYFANVFSPSGVRVTRHFPPREGIDAMDHATLHPGIWLAFGDINGSDFWRGKNEVRHLRFVDEPSVIDEGVEFSVESEYVVGSEAICRERSHHKILRRPSGYLFLFDSSLRALRELDFGDQQEMGLGIRLATPLRVARGSGEIVDSEGRVNEAEGWGRRAKWCDYSGIIAGKRSGVMLMPSPENFRPSRFHSRDYGFTVANPFCDKDFGRGDPHHIVIKRGDQLRLRFGVLVYSTGDSAPIDQESAYASFLETQQSNDKPARTK